MKVRISNGQLRFRISQEELIQLKEEKTVEVSTVFSPIDRMNIRLACWHLDTCGYAFEALTLECFIPKLSISVLEGGKTFSSSIQNEIEVTSNIVVEVDLPCKH